MAHSDSLSGAKSKFRTGLNRFVADLVAIVLVLDVSAASDDSLVSTN